MKKTLMAISFLMAIVLIVALTACTNNPRSSDVSSRSIAEVRRNTINTDKIPKAATHENNYGFADANITIFFMGATVADDTAVVEAANARLAELGYNITINPIWGDWGAGTPIQMALDTGDTSIDIVFTSSWDAFYVPNANRGNFLRLDNPEYNLIEWFGEGMQSAVPQALWDGFLTDGSQGRGIYGIPGHKDYAQLYAWDVNVELLEELGFSFDDFNWSYETLFDPLLVEAMEVFQERLGTNVFPFLMAPEGVARSLSNADFDITGLGVFHFGFDPVNPTLPTQPTVTPSLLNEEYMRVLERFNYFFDRGFINPLSAIQGESSSANQAAIESGNFLFSTITYAYGHQELATQQRGRDSRFPPMSSPIVSTGSVTGSGYAISIFSQQKEQAMRFLNAWYTDPELATILTYGVEGLHFTRNANGTITLDSDMRAQFNPWRNGTGNIFILPPLDVEGADFYDRFREYNEAGVPTAFLGFSFDETPVINEMAALRNVVAEFQTTVTTGAVNPATQGAEYLARLNANGLEAVQQELNRQLAEFFDN
ncbi:MAG: ABC transporter substrate-binding protein [Defluviitaleaceae bacterium]|nr:ABC transporter substrate-binding protein [Defluviitaleaceae bacterium]